MTEPLYRRIADDLRALIESGQLPPASRLPSEQELGQRYDRASRNTIREAIRLLHNRGLVETRAGQGTFVVAPPDPFVTAVTLETGFARGEGATYASEGQQEPTVSVPRIEIQQASSVVMTELALEPDTEVVIRHQLRYIGDRPWSMQTTFYPMKLVHAGAAKLIQPKNIDGGAIQYIERELHIKEIGSHDVMKVRPPTVPEALFFQLDSEGRTAVFETRQVGVNKSDEPLRVTVSIFGADRTTFAMNTGELAKLLSP
jgi:GntR family transcriptional regulator